ncbi:MAG: polysaccharide deacetylase family protein [Lachnospiraceae bacterium]|nr:polysaccharide deacetylase family protein [Lachnospiraceae bacterium]
MIKKTIFVEIFIVVSVLLCVLIFRRQTTVVTQTDEEKRRIALTFDDGPGKYTEELLDGLLERNVKATFFLIGKNAEMYPEIVKRIEQEGHIIGNHTYSHVKLTCISNEKAIEEIRKTNSIIENITGKKVEYIRPPFGNWTKKLENSVNMKPVFWSVDPRDWSVLNTDTVTCHIVNNTSEGDIVLMHDIFETSVDAAMNVVDILQQKGYEFVTVEDMFGSEEK